MKDCSMMKPKHNNMSKQMDIEQSKKAHDGAIKELQNKMWISLNVSQTTCSTCKMKIDIDI